MDWVGICSCVMRGEWKIVLGMEEEKGERGSTVDVKEMFGSRVVCV